MKKIVRQIYGGVKQVGYRIFGSKVECNLCQYRAAFLWSDSWHEHVICPKCKSTVRERLLWASLNGPGDLNLNRLILGKRVLHFAPEFSLTRLLRKKASLYETADFMAEGYTYTRIDRKLDISDMKSIKEGSYDCVIACDVLEHVPDHQSGMKEVFRVLAKGGCCIFTVPQKDHLEKTEEDLTVMSSEEREKRFGQWDHLRIYGNDFPDMLREAGFRMKEVSEQDFSKPLGEKFVLFPPVLSSHPMATNYRKIFFGFKD